MPQKSSQSYSLSEIAQIIGVDEKKLHHLAHKGLINPVLSNDPAGRFTQLDCERLKIIERADELGYAPDSIFNLIGKPGEISNAPDPVAACESFAMEKYKQIYDELNHCELLEQINKQCDLKLLKAYIKGLKELQKKGSPDSEAPITKRRTEPPPSTVGVREKTSRSDQPSKPTPRIQSYSVEKLWDYFKNVEEAQKDARAGRQQAEPRSQDGLQPDFDGDVDSWEPQKQGPWRFSEAQRLLDSEYWHTRAEGLRATLGRQDWTAWMAVGLLIAIIAVAGYFMVSGHKRQASQKPMVALNTDQQGQEDAKSPVPEKAVESTPTQPSAAIDENHPAPKPKQPAEQKHVGQPPDAGTLYSPDSIKDSAPSAASGKPVQPREHVATPAVEQSAPAAAPVAQLDKPAAVSEDRTTASKAPAVVRVADLHIWHDNLNSYYRADFTILKRNAADEELVDGYAFVYLLTGSTASGEKGLLLPSGEQVSGPPNQFEQGARFSIRHLKEMRVAASSTLPPDDITSGKILVYSLDGKLVLDQPFNIPVQPFFSTVGERYDASVEKLTGAAPPAAGAPVKPDSRPAVKVEAPATVSPTKAEAPQPEKIVSPPPVETVVGSTEAKQAPPAAIDATSGTRDVRTPPQSVEKKPVPVEKPQVVAMIQKTDNPEAAVWEQKSYDAATQGDFDSAIRHATLAIKLDPGRVNPYVNRAWAYIERNKLDDAIHDCGTALSIDSQNALAYNNRGLAYQLKNNTRKAQDDYRKACDLGLQLGCQNFSAVANQNRIADLIDQSQRAFKDKDWDSVIRSTTEVLSLDPENSVAYTNRSAAYAQKSYLRKALKDSNEAINYNPEFGLAYNNRGYVFELLGNNQKATADYLKSCSLGLDLGCKNYERLNR